MVELLVRLEYKRRALRRRVLGTLGISGDRYYGIAFVLFLILMFGLLSPGTWLGLPFLAVVIIAFVLLGIALLFTIVLAPASLLFF